MNQHVPTVADFISDSSGPPTGVELMHLGHSQCRYPVHSTGKHHLFCGLPARGSWCRAHGRQVMTPPRPRKR